MSTRNRRRRGLSVVELAVFLSLVVTLFLGAIELGRAIAVQQTLTEAARAGCRLYAIHHEKTEADVRDMVDQCLARAGLEGHTIEFDPGPGAKIKQLTPVTVTVSIPFDRVAWLAGNVFMSGSTLTGTCTMPADIGDKIPEDIVDGGTNSTEVTAGGDDDG